METDNEDVSDGGMTERIRACARIAGSGDELARVSGVNRRTLESYLSGQREPKASTAWRIAVAVNVSADWLIGGKGPMRPGEKDAQSCPSQQAIDMSVIQFCAKVAAGAFEAVKAEGLARDMDTPGFYDVVEGLIQIESYKGIPEEGFSPNVTAYRKLLGNKKL